MAVVFPLGPLFLAHETWRGASDEKGCVFTGWRPPTRDGRVLDQLAPSSSTGCSNALCTRMIDTRRGDRRSPAEAKLLLQLPLMHPASPASSRPTATCIGCYSLFRLSPITPPRHQRRSPDGAIYATAGLWTAVEVLRPALGAVHVLCCACACA